LGVGIGIIPEIGCSRSELGGGDLLEKGGIVRVAAKTRLKKNGA